MRLFIAAYPPPAPLADLTAYVSTLAIGRPRGPGGSLRLEPPERIHLTLVFLGDVAEDRLPAVKAATASGVERWAAGREKRVGRPVVSVGGGGRFGSGRFTTVWAGVRGDTAGLGDLVKDLRRDLHAARLPFDVKPFRPHVTLARPADRLAAGELAADLAALDRYQGPEWEVGSIDLVESHQGPNIVYDRIAAFPL